MEPAGEDADDVIEVGERVAVGVAVAGAECNDSRCARCLTQRVGDDAVEIVGRSILLLGITALVSAIPAATYWLARHSWMPELTRFVWVVWLVVGFAFTYGNYLVSLGEA